MFIYNNRRSKKYWCSLLDVEEKPHDDEPSGTFIERALDASIIENSLDQLPVLNHNSPNSTNPSKVNNQSPKMLDQSLASTSNLLLLRMNKVIKVSNELKNSQRSLKLNLHEVHPMGYRPFQRQNYKNARQYWKNQAVERQFIMKKHVIGDDLSPNRIQISMMKMTISMMMLWMKTKRNLKRKKRLLS